jgi:RNA polymerase sigma-70 factor (ECF subfamily)
MEPGEPEERVADVTPTQSVVRLAAAAGAASAEVPPLADTEHPAPFVLAQSVLGFDDFYRQARPRIGRALALALGDVDLAVEATDEALTRACERWPVVSQLERPEAWVYRVGLNWSLSILRRRRRSPIARGLYDPDAVDAPAIGDPAVHLALADLDVKHRSVVICRYLLGWSVADTAAALRLREGTVKSRLHRATRALQHRLQHLHPDRIEDEHR